MLSLKAILLPLLSFYVIGFLIAVLYMKPASNFRTLPAHLQDLNLFNSNFPAGTTFKFKNKDLAGKVLKQLDVYQPMSKKYGTSEFSIPFFGVKKDDAYCDKHRDLFVHYPEMVFEDVNVILNSRPTTLIRTKMIENIANDIHPEIGYHMPDARQNISHVDLKLYTNIFFSKNPMYYQLQLGKHYSCLSQESNHIPGHNTLDRKDAVAVNAKDYAKKFLARPECFNHDKFFPRTWLLERKDECQEFFKTINSAKYQEEKEEKRIVYIRKVAYGSHRGEGVQPVTDEEEKALKNEYANGLKCGEVKLNYIIQSYIHNPLLINGHKFDFRMYMLIASTNPLMAFYHDGFLRVTLAKYDINSDEKKVLLTNLALNQQVYDEVKGGSLYEGMDEEELKVAQQWSFDRLQEYLLEKGIIRDPNWLDNYLRPEFKKAMIHLLRLSSYNFMKHSSLYELYGVDFMLDENLNLWFIEANSSPALYGYSQPMEKFIVKMVQDHYEVVMGLLRSRMKRVVMYINQIIDEGKVESLSSTRISIPEFTELKDKFDQITQNYYEEEFMPSPTNGFSKIVDENLYGVNKYLGYIQPECL